MEHAAAKAALQPDGDPVTAQANKAAKRRRRKPSQPAAPDLLQVDQPTVEQAADEHDIVSDILARVKAIVPGVTSVTFREIEAGVRQDWGGERPYVAKVGESGREAQSQRDRAIRAQARRGDHVKLLARRHGLSEKRIRQILSDTADG